MKYIYTGMLIIFVVLQYSFWSSAETRLKIEVVRAKHSMESAAYSACKAISYADERSLLELGNGFGEGLTSPLNIPLDEERGIANFDEIFLDGLSVKDPLKKEMLRKSVVLKVWVGFDGFRIKHGEEEWKEKEAYLLDTGGETYKLNFSEHLVRSRDGKMLHWSEVEGVNRDTARNRINSIISTRINDELLQNSAAYIGTGKRYLTFLSDITGQSSSLPAFSGPGFIAILDGVKIPGMNIPDRKCLNLYSVGGSDLCRSMEP